MKKELVKYTFLTFVLVVVITFIYPTIYRYDKYDQRIPVRINRITGHTEMLNYNGWFEAAPDINTKINEAIIESPSPSPTAEPDATYNGETFNQFYERSLKENTMDTMIPKNHLYYAFERARLGINNKLVELRDYFSIGSTKEDVKKVMGLPESINKELDQWGYGAATVTFKNGKVIEFHDTLNILYVR